MEKRNQNMREVLDSLPEVEIDIVGADLKLLKDFLLIQAKSETRRLATSVYEKTKPWVMPEAASVSEKIVQAIKFAAANNLNIRLRKDGEKQLFCVKTKRDENKTGPDNRQEFELEVTAEERVVIESLLNACGYELSAVREKERTTFVISHSGQSFKVDIDEYPAVGLKNEASVKAYKVEVEGPDEVGVKNFAESIIQKSGAGGVMQKSTEAQFLKSQGYPKKKIRQLRFNYE
ncbi:MAG: CYTH domain-containing protein [Candidatus Doudnabacteria bacterium]|nr:CYTH domain-containing protein [Candidatus Doudnabacteria bacterium]